MLRRHSARSKSDLHRSKSTPSARSVPLEHIDAAVAQRDARLAAVQAYSREQDRRSAEPALFPPQQDSPHTGGGGSPVQLSRNESSASRNSEHGGQGLGRRQSVRFVGSASGPQTRAPKISTRFTAPDREVVIPPRSVHRSESSQNVGGIRNNVLLDTQNIQPSGRGSSCGKALATPRPALKHNYLQALAPDLERYMPEDDIASVPSSYRRVRKTRSMFTTRLAVRGSDDGAQPAPLFASTSAARAQQVTSTRMSRFPFLNRKENDPAPLTPALKAPKSMSFLKHRRDHRDGVAPVQNSAYNDSSMSPEPPMQENSSRTRILPKPSIFSGPKGSKIGQSMRETLRHSSSNAVLPTTETTASMTTSIHGSMKIKARKVSSSIKSRFKNLFINKSEDDTKLPAQQVEALRTHVSDVFDGDQFRSVGNETVGTLERRSVSRVSSHIPSLHAVRSSEQLRSRKGSIDGFPDENRHASDERSRVTSWASTETNTVVAQRPQESSSDELQKQRLSVITECGLRAPSPSLTRPKLSLQTITSQEELAPPTITERLPTGATVDSQRVYSALMKRVDEARQLYDEVIEQRKSSGDSDPFRTLSPPTSDDSSDGGDPTNLPQNVPETGLCKQVRNVLETSRSTPGATSSSCRALPGPEPGDNPSLEPPVHLVPQAADSAALKPITDRSSAFFGSPTSHLFRTRSPWRRSLQDAIERDGIPSQSLTMGATDSVATTTTANDTADKNADSASNYSQDTQVHNWAVNSSFHTAGPSPSVQPPTYRPTGERIVSTASSVDWKTSLSYDVEKTERPPPSPTRVTGCPSEVEYVVPTMPRAFGHGHVREAAQIGPYDEDEEDSAPAVRQPTNPTTPLGCIEPNVIKLTPQQRSVMQTTPPYRIAASYEEGRMPMALPKDAMRPRASPLESNGSCGEAMPGQDCVAIRQAKSLAHMQAYCKIRAEETGSPRPHGTPTVRLMRKTAAKLEPNSGSATSTPGFSSAFERHFGSLTLPRRLGDHAAKENRSPHVVEAGGGNSARGESPTTKAQVRGSKTMIDLFLNTRRRQGASSDGPAFV